MNIGSCEHPLGYAFASVGLEHKDIAHIRKGRTIGDDPNEPDLIFGAIWVLYKRTNHKRSFNSSLKHLSADALAPIGSAQEGID